jgi:hypothetical protein
MACGCISAYIEHEMYDIPVLHQKAPRTRPNTGSISRRRLEIPARQMDEPRFLAIDSIGNKYWSAVVTYREEIIRLISVLRSHDEDIALYEQL